MDLSKDNKVYRKGVHQLVAMTFVPGWFEGAVVNHKDANTLNNHYTNLEWVTQKENINKSYETSGINAVRNYLYYIIVYPNGNKSPKLKGSTEVKKYIDSHNLDVSHSMLMRRGYSRNFKLITLR
ncbi:DNA endonuclease [Enterocloster phage CB473P3]|nr:DNA endonuclease [Enterocloster phage CB473P3]